MINSQDTRIKLNQYNRLIMKWNEILDVGYRGQTKQYKYLKSKDTNKIISDYYNLSKKIVLLQTHHLNEPTFEVGNAIWM